MNKYESPVDYFIKSEKDSFTKICKVCGEPLKPEEFFCSKCGHKVNNDVDSSKKNLLKQTGTFIIKKGFLLVMPYQMDFVRCSLLEEELAEQNTGGGFYSYVLPMV